MAADSHADRRAIDAESAVRRPVRRQPAVAVQPERDPEPVADQGRHDVPAARLRIPLRAGDQLQPHGGRRGARAAHRSARGHDAQRQHRRRAGALRRQAHAQRLRQLRLRRHPRRHPAVHRRLPRPAVHRPAAGHPPLRHARQQPVAVQPGLVPAAGEGHQQRPERHRQAAAQREHLRRQPLPAGLSVPGFTLQGTVIYDDNRETTASTTTTTAS